jgi:hypothetical protein
MKRLLLLLIIGFYGCETRNVEKQNTDFEIDGCNLHLYVIDSCEYLGFVYCGQSDKLTHKGNCKFCTERLSKQKK